MKSVYKFIRESTKGCQSPGGERYRKAAWTTIVLSVTRMVNILTGLLTVPLTFTYLGAEQFGLWMALTNFVAFLSFTDLGLGIGLQNGLISCNGRDDYNFPGKLVASAVVVMTAIFLLLVVFAVMVLPFVPLDRLISTETEVARRQLLPTAQAVIIAFGFGLPAGLVQRMCDAYQRGYLGYSLLLIGRIMGFLAVVSAVFLHWPLWLLASSYVGMPFVVSALGSLWVFRAMPWLVPRFSTVDRACIKSIFQTGVQATVIRVANAIMNNGPALIIANRLGASFVGPFAVAQKFVGVTNIVTMSVGAALYGAYGEAALRGDWTWIKRTLKRAVMLSIITYFGAAVVSATCGLKIISWWTGEGAAVPSLSLLLACIFFFALSDLQRVFGQFLMGINRLTLQATYSLVLALLSFFCGYIFIELLGVAGTIWLVAAVGMGGQLVFKMVDSLTYIKRSQRAYFSCMD